MKEEDKILLTLGWGIIFIGIILLMCRLTYRTDQIDKKLDDIADNISDNISAASKVATFTDATITDATPTEPSSDEIVMSVKPELLDISEDTLECSETTFNELTEEIYLEELTSVSEASESVVTPVRSGLTKSSGVYQGPSGKETYYNLDMSGVVSIMRGMGYSEAEYPYWIREDGVKMLGNYVIVAADFNTRPRGTILETSLGTGIVCDTGAFAYSNCQAIDIATAW